jgi:pyruvate,water dikinase
MENSLDQVGRLLASSRLLDMGIANEAAMQRMIEGFFAGNYDFLNQAQEIRLPGFYTHTGEWQRVEEDGRTLLLQDGSDYGSSLSGGLANFMGKMMGAKYQELLDNIEAYYYFPRPSPRTAKFRRYFRSSQARGRSRPGRRPGLRHPQYKHLLRAPGQCPGR